MIANQGHYIVEEDKENTAPFELQGQGLQGRKQLYSRKKLASREGNNMTFHDVSNTLVEHGRLVKEGVPRRTIETNNVSPELCTPSKGTNNNNINTVPPNSHSQVNHYDPKFSISPYYSQGMKTPPSSYSVDQHSNLSSTPRMYYLPPVVEPVTDGIYELSRFSSHLNRSLFANQSNHHGYRRKHLGEDMPKVNSNRVFQIGKTFRMRKVNNGLVSRPYHSNPNHQLFLIP